MKKTSTLQKLINECVALAIKICITLKPNCELCGQPSQTAHHFVHQARSNYLRCDQKNLISICQKCHCKIHIGNSEGIIGAIIRGQRGKAWENYILAGTQKKIKSDLFYWKKQRILLEDQLN